MSATHSNGSWGTRTVTTAANGTSWTTLANINCDEVLIVNSSGTAISIRNSGETSGTGVKIPDSSFPTITVGGNANEIQVRRTDLSTTTVTVGYIFRYAT
jgi:hypothetical protein